MEAKGSPGSFVSRDKLIAEVEQQRRPRPPVPGETSPARPPAATPQAAAPAADTDAVQAQAEEAAETRRQGELLKLKVAYENLRGVKLTEAHLRDYIFRGALRVPGVSIVPGFMEGTFATHTPRESELIEKRLAAYRSQGGFTPEGLENERAILILAHGWTHAGETGKDIRSLGETAEDREATIRKMGVHVIEHAGEAWNQVNFLLKYALREKSFVKKS